MNIDFVVFAVIALVVVAWLNAVLGDWFAGRAPAKATGYAANPLLNRSERRIHAILEPIAREMFGVQSRLLTQVSYGEFLKSADHRSFLAINQKRADFVVADRDFNVLCVLEYQGTGHRGRSVRAGANADHRDRVKRGALASAGIPIVEIPATADAQEMRALIEAGAPRRAAGDHPGAAGSRDVSPQSATPPLTRSRRRGWRS